MGLIIQGGATLGNSGVINANNGLSLDATGDIAQLGGSLATPSDLLQNRYINTTANYFLQINGAKTGNATTDGIFRVINSGNGSIAIYGEVTGTGVTSRGVYGRAVSGVGVYGDGIWGVLGTSSSTSGVLGIASASAIGVTGISVDNVAIYGQRENTTTNDIITILSIARNTTGTAQTGIGAAIEMQVELSDGTSATPATLIAKWANAAVATRRSQFIIRGIYDAVEGDFLRLGNRAFEIGDLSALNSSTKMLIDDVNRQAVFTCVSGIKITGDTTMIHSGTAYTNGAAAAAGTLLNAPAAGNPTKWIPVDDNGTTRYIPAW